MLGRSVPSARAEEALAPLELARLEAAGLLEADEGGVRAGVKLVAHGELLIASDPEHVRGADWVAGIHGPSVTLARLTMRVPAERALDLCTGNGIQALLLSKHCASVVATDVNPRALRFAKLNARLNAVENVELREGSFFEPVAGERFDLIVANPPYVVSPESVYAFRDSGLPGDEVSRQVARDAAEHLVDGGVAHVLVSWGHEPGDWRTPLVRWVADLPCDAWLLHFDSEDPLAHAASWLKSVEPAEFEPSVDRWVAYLRELGIASVGYGAVVLRRRADGPGWVRAEDASLALGEAGGHLLRLFANQDLLARGEDLLEATLTLVPEHRLEQTQFARDGGLVVERATLALRQGIGFEVELDEHALALLPHLDGSRSAGDVLAARADEVGIEREAYAEAGSAVVRRLLELGFLERGR